MKYQAEDGNAYNMASLVASWTSRHSLTQWNFQQLPWSSPNQWFGRPLLIQWCRNLHLTCCKYALIWHQSSELRNSCKVGPCDRYHHVRGWGETWFHIKLSTFQHQRRRRQESFKTKELNNWRFSVTDDLGSFQYMLRYNQYMNSSRANEPGLFIGHTVWSHCHTNSHPTITTSRSERTNCPIGKLNLRFWRICFVCFIAAILKTQNQPSHTC